MIKNTLIKLLILCLTLVLSIGLMVGCASLKPDEYKNEADGQMSGPGLITDKSGELVIFRIPEKTKDQTDKSQPSVNYKVIRDSRLIDRHDDPYDGVSTSDGIKKPALRDTNEAVNAEPDIGVSSKDDLYSELMKLKKLLDEGIITQEEFEVEKKEILEKY